MLEHDSSSSVDDNQAMMVRTAVCDEKIVGKLDMIFGMGSFGDLAALISCRFIPRLTLNATLSDTLHPILPHLHPIPFLSIQPISPAQRNPLVGAEGFDFSFEVPVPASPPSRFSSTAITSSRAIRFLEHWAYLTCTAEPSGRGCEL